MGNIDSDVAKTPTQTHSADLDTKENQGTVDTKMHNANTEEQLIGEQRVEEQEIQEHGLLAMHQRLCGIDPVAGARISAADPQRITRAMEVFLLTGETLTSHWARQKQQQLPYQVTSIGVWPEDRALLHQRIEQRFEAMLGQGFEQEVKSLMARKDLHLDLPSMRCVGYRQMWQHLSGEYDYATMQDKGIVATRQLAKRQLTWLRSWPQLHTFDSLDAKLTFNVLQLFDRIR